MLFNKSKFLVVAVCAGMLTASTSASAIDTAPYSTRAANTVFKAVGVLGLTASTARAILNLSLVAMSAQFAELHYAPAPVQLSIYTAAAALVGFVWVRDVALTAAAAYLSGGLVELIAREPKQSPKNHCCVIVVSE